ncbi:MAG: acetylornithine deacetylase/succinyl-diaminopimelate desuccinylase-like protein [Myxococcota bacterium]|jgi:acetylornithine deacetylase/succinyl-diaminopimelate desuccinylase-like protein
MNADRAALVAEHADQRFDAAVEELSGYLAIPAISCDPAHSGDVHLLATQIRDAFAELGLTKARLLELPDALPCVAAEWMGAGPDAPTVLIYGHLDLQPVEEANWSSPPHTPEQRNGRLYARGAADDMGGWVSHIAALRSWMAVAGGPPCNLRLLIEGEEEIGSPNLERFIDAFPEAFRADVMILTDCENPSPELPGLTVSLRGLMELELTCAALEADVHSGLWGNMVPDPCLALVSLIGRLVDADGRLSLGRVFVPAQWSTDSRAVPLNEAVIRDGARLLDGVSPLPERGRPPAEWMWRQPAITIVSTTLPSPAQKKNAIRSRASAILSVRLAPGQEPEDLRPLIEAELLRDPPGGVKVTLTEGDHSGGSWLYEPKGPAFEAADRAYKRVWGAEMIRVGVGGSIPFVAIFGRRFGDLPLILNGVMDPKTSAHGPDESMHLGIFRKAIAANIYLLEELAALGKAGLSADR